MGQNQPSKKYVVAGNRHEFESYRAKKRTENSPYLYVYVDGVHTIMGLNSVSGVFIGTFARRADIQEIVMRIRQIQAVSGDVVGINGAVLPALRGQTRITALGGLETYDGTRWVTIYE